MRTFDREGVLIEPPLRESDILLISRAVGDTANFFELWEEFSCMFNVSPLELIDSVVKLIAALKVHPLGIVWLGDRQYSSDQIILSLQKFTSTSELSLINVNLDPDSKANIIAKFRDNFISSESNTGITVRELEVIEGILHGLGNKEIASWLGISVSTVKNHLRSIFAKMDVYNRSDIATVAMNWLIDKALSREI